MSNKPARGHFLSVRDVTDIDHLVEQALLAKRNPLGEQHIGQDKKVGLIFLNPSLRTRLSTQLAAHNLGLYPIIFNVDKEGWALEFEDGAIMSGHTAEHVKDAAPILGRYFDLLCIRAFPGLVNKEEDYSEMIMQAFVQYAGVPVISLESATLHPLQSLSDVITIHENWPDARRPKIVLTWAPHIRAIPQCVANSFSEWMVAWGKADFTIAFPDDYALDPRFTNGATLTHDQNEALDGADFVYVKNWSTYTDYGKIYSNDAGWMLTEEKLKGTRSAKVMHCLPVRRNVELSDEILDGPSSLVTEQAANRVWAAQAVLSGFLRNGHV